MVWPFLITTEVLVWRRRIVGLFPGATTVRVVVSTLLKRISICMATFKSLVMRGRTFKPIPTAI